MEKKEEILIQDLISQKRESIRLLKGWKEEERLTEKLSAENSKLKEENKIILSDIVSEIIGLLLLENNAKKVSEYMDIVETLRDRMRWLQDEIRDNLREEESKDKERLRDENKRLDKNYKIMLFSFFVMFGSRLVLVIKLYLL